MPKMLKKLTPKSIIGDVKKLSKQYESGTIVPLYDLVGVVDTFETGESNYGPWTAFKGDFAFTSHLNPDDSGEAKKAFVHEPVLSYLLDAVTNNEAVEFAITVSLRVDDELPTGYEYVCESMIDVKPNTRLAHLTQLMKPKALPSPAGEEPETKPKAPAKKAASK